MTKITRKTDVMLEGRGMISLQPCDHMITGGEGSIYKKNNTVIKLYTDSDKMIRDGMDAKIIALKRVEHPFIVTPEGMVKDVMGKPIGYYMPYVTGEPITRVFTNDYRARTQFADDDAHMLVDHMRTVVQHVHSKRIVMADANEMNWLVDDLKKHAPEPRAIDVDAWAIDRWRARVIMPSIRDWHAKVFDELSDWFAWGIVTFQVYAGIHPYKGRLSGYAQHDLAKRMQDNASVFHSDVRLNHAVRDFGRIPSGLRQWYEEVFAKGKRVVPPSPFDVGKIVPTRGRIAHTQVTAKGMLVFDKMYESTSHITRIFDGGVVLCADGVLVDVVRGKKICTVTKKNVAIVVQHDGWFVAECENDTLMCRFVDLYTGREEIVDTTISARNVMSMGERMFVVTERGLTEIMLTRMKRSLLSMGNTWQTLPYATQWFHGVGVENVMGNIHVIAPFGDRACATIRVKELDGLVPIAGYGGTRFITIITLDTQGMYHKHEFHFDAAYRAYTIWSDVVDSAELVITALPKGVCATIVEDGALDIFVPSNGAHTKVSDGLIKTGTHLVHIDNTVIYVDDRTVWRVRMK
ncbi:MAG: hypothetical protein WC819_04595 [Parcubacteria group bacterium]